MTVKPLQLVKERRPVSPPPRPVAEADAPPPLLAPKWHALIPIVILALWALAISGVDVREMSDVGLISVMPIPALALLVLLTVSFCLALRERPVRPLVAGMHVFVLIVILYGVTAFLEPEARIASVYRHVGIINTLIADGGVNGDIDAYFNWPGLLGLGALLTQAAGLESAISMANWSPLVLNLLYALPLLVIFRWATDDTRLHWLGLWVFFSTNWVGQDYFSPQGTAFALWLAILAALLTRFTPRPAVLTERVSIAWVLRLLDPRRVIASLRADRDAERAEQRSRRGDATLLLLLVAIYAAIVSGHQLTPFPIVFATGALVLFAGLRTRNLPVIMGVLLAAWISYPATPYLIGHVEELAGSVGSTSENLTANVSERIGGSPGHAFIVNLRIAGTAFIWLLAVAGFTRRIRGRNADVAFVILGLTPLVLPVLQPYGGEMVLRVFFFTLPVAAFFIAALAFPTPSAGRSWRTIAAVGVLCVTLLGLFQYMRYGNERLDHFTGNDVAAVNALYRLAPEGSVLVGSSNLPWKATGYTGYIYRSVLETRAWRSALRPQPAALQEEIAGTAPPEGSYVIVTRSMMVEASLLGGKPGVLQAFVARLRNNPDVQHLYRGNEGDVFLVAQAEGARAPGSGQAKPAPKPPATQPAKPAAPKRTTPRPARPSTRRPAARPPAPGRRVNTPPPPPPPVAVQPPPHHPRHHDRRRRRRRRRHHHHHRRHRHRRRRSTTQAEVGPAGAAQAAAAYVLACGAPPTPVVAPMQRMPQQTRHDSSAYCAPPTPVVAPMRRMTHQTRPTPARRACGPVVAPSGPMATPIRHDPRSGAPAAPVVAPYRGPQMPRPGATVAAPSPTQAPADAQPLSMQSRTPPPMTTERRQRTRRRITTERRQPDRPPQQARERGQRGRTTRKRRLAEMTLLPLTSMPRTVHL